MKAGQVDANAEPDFVDADAEFPNSSAGYTPTLLDFPTYPKPRMSLNLFVYPMTNLYGGAGVYRDPAEHDAGFSEAFWIGEADLTKRASEKWGTGRVALGGCHASATFDRSDGGDQRGAHRSYALAEQQVWCERPRDAKDTQGLSLLAQYGYGEEEVNAFDQHASVGVFAVGLVPSRDNDSLGQPPREVPAAYGRETPESFRKSAPHLRNSLVQRCPPAPMNRS